MRVPGVLQTVLIAGAYALIESLTTGVVVLEGWWVPVAVAVLGLVAKWLELLRSPKRADMRSLEREPGYWERLILG